MAGAATLIDSDLVEDCSNGIIEYQYTEVYQTIASSATEGPDSILSASGLPTRLSKKLVGSTGTYVWCVRRQPKRQGLGADRLRWIVTCTFTNLNARFEKDDTGSPIDDPLDVVPRLDITFQEKSAPITKAILRDVQNKSGATVSTFPTDMPVDSVWRYVVNSAGDKIERERRSTHKIITVHKTVRNWNNAWDAALNTVNSAAITLKQSDIDGDRLSKSFAAKTLLLADVQKYDIWKNGRLYFDVGFVLYENPDTWRHTEPDAGTRRWIETGQYKHDGSQYVSGDFTGGLVDGSYQEIPTYNDEGEIAGLIGDPIPFNGNGMEIPVRNADTSDTRGQSYTLHFDIYDETDFAALGIA